ncbi:MAG: hypothetical protein QCH99_11065 [Candidatus Bathyarchaeota archaeon]|nr:hypothetical protein [Candidatus Bathyarchaeum tardum]WGM89016.1 MAG: hypothetical protein NUK63_08875 [Candidatus Bathyarchaeum tardum]
MNKKMIYVVFIVVIVILGVCSAWLLIRSENLQNQVNSIEDEKSQLQTLIADLQNQVTTKDFEITDLNDQINELREAKLMNVGTGASDHNDGQPPYLYVYGYICNIGRETAYNAKIHVTANHINGETAIDTYIDIDQTPSITEGLVYTLQQFITYDGISIDTNSITITPEWTNEP